MMKLLPRMIVSFGLLVGFTGELGSDLSRDGSD